MTRKKGLTPEETERLERELRELQAQVRELIAFLRTKLGETGSAA